MREMCLLRRTVLGTAEKTVEFQKNGTKVGVAGLDTFNVRVIKPMGGVRKIPGLTKEGLGSSARLVLEVNEFIASAPGNHAKLIETSINHQPASWSSPTWR